MVIIGKSRCTGIAGPKVHLVPVIRISVFSSELVSFSSRHSPGSVKANGGSMLNPSFQKEKVFRDRVVSLPRYVILFHKIQMAPLGFMPIPEWSVFRGDGFILSACVARPPRLWEWECERAWQMEFSKRKIRGSLVSVRKSEGGPGHQKPQASAVGQTILSVIVCCFRVTVYTTFSSSSLSGLMAVYCVCFVSLYF